jgi:uncharacterized repeat protein (TIGR01451 family)
MKALVVCFMVLWATFSNVSAQTSREEVGISLKNLAVTFHNNPQKADARALPFVDGKLLTGSKEAFGICFAGASAAGPAVEILDKNGSTVKSISNGELLSAKGSSVVAFPAGKGAGQPRWMVTSYNLDLPTGKARLLVKALATGNPDGDQQLVVTFALQSETAAALALRLSLPVSGAVETQGKGFMLEPKTGASAIAAAVYPGSATVGGSRNLLAVTTKPVALESNKEAAVVWMVFDGFSGTSKNAAREQAAAALRQGRIAEGDPKVVIVTMVNKQSTQPGDTVTYNIVCKNVGNADATDVALRSPVSDGTNCLEESVTSDGGNASFTRSGSALRGSVKSIAWSFPAPLKPGEERMVGFKVRVQ